MNARMKWMAAVCLLVFAFAMDAQAAAQDARQDMDMATHEHHVQGTRHAKPSNTATAAPRVMHHTHDMATMDTPMPAQPMQGHSMQIGSAPAGARSPDYSDGYRYGSMAGTDMYDDPVLGMLMLDRLEAVHSRAGGSAAAVDGEAWYGRNFNKLWLKFEGEHGDGHWRDLRIEALWDHALASFWGAQLGLRHDLGIGPGRTWVAFGIEGLAPYRFETQATFYVGQGGRTAARIALEYEARFTQRLILQPSIEANFYGRDDPQRGIGSGLSDVEAGLRLRYEIRRQFAPYVGVAWHRRFGHARDFVRANGEPVDDLQFVAGVRVWF